jgi:hypothetical protein
MKPGKRIDWTLARDIEVIALASMGMFSRAIGAKVGLSPGQAQYRVAVGDASVLRKEFREGRGDTFKMAHNIVSSAVIEAEQPRLMAKVKKRAAEVEKKRRRNKAVNGKAGKR